MSKATIALLVVSSLLNAAIASGAFVFGGFATSPQMADATMRIGYYVLKLILAAGLAGMVMPWFLVHWHGHKGALFVAILPVLLTLIAILAFLLLDSWLQRTFGG